MGHGTSYCYCCSGASGAGAGAGAQAGVLELRVWSGWMQRGWRELEFMPLPAGMALRRQINPRNRGGKREDAGVYARKAGERTSL